MGVLEDIKEQYPSLAWLVNDPEVGPLLRDAVDPNKGFSPQTFQAKLYQTGWFKSRSTAARQIDILQKTDPGEYKRQYTSHLMALKGMSTRLGLNIPQATQRYMAAINLRNGVAIGSDEFNYNMSQFLQNPANRKVLERNGSIQGAQMDMRRIAQSEFFLPVSAKEQRDWGVQLALGLKDESALREHLSNRAASLYPHLKDLLQKGASMEDIFSGHRAVLAEELELSPDQIDFRKDWTKVLHQIDPTDKKPRPMTLHETQTLARQDQRWWSTAKGKSQDAGMANTMLKMFGKRK